MLVVQGARDGLTRIMAGTSPRVYLPPHMTGSSRPYSSIFAYCKWLKTRSGKGLGMRPVQRHNIANQGRINPEGERACNSRTGNVNGKIQNRRPDILLLDRRYYC